MTSTKSRPFWTINVEFYLDTQQMIPQIKCLNKLPKYNDPNRKLGIEDFYNELKGLERKDRFHAMEHEHLYIQWIFPTFTTSEYNDESWPLLSDEATICRHNHVIAFRFLRFYLMFISFLGGTVVDLKTGEIKPTEDVECCKARFKNFNYSSHNYKRITRIFNSLHAFGFGIYMRTLYRFLKKNHKEHFPNCKDSMRDYWKPALECDRKVNEEPKDFKYEDSVLLKLIQRIDVSKIKNGKTQEIMTVLENKILNKSSKIILPID